jgi:hypothetical protein
MQPTLGLTGPQRSQRRACLPGPFAKSSLTSLVSSLAFGSLKASSHRPTGEVGLEAPTSDSVIRRDRRFSGNHTVLRKSSIRPLV